MRICVIGRTRMLIDAARQLDKEGHQIPIVVTAPEEQFYGVGVSDFKLLAKDLMADFLEWPRISTQDIAVVVKNLKCDLAISMNWPVLIPPALLTAFGLGILNAHAGDLPKFRGNACPNWVILNGEKSLGLTIHQMDEGLDSGPIVLKEIFEVTSATYIGDIYEWLSLTVPKAFLKAINLLQDSTFTPSPQPKDPAKSLRTFPRRPSDGQINWSDDANQIARLVRASSHPFAGAFTFLEHGPKITIWRAEPFQSKTSYLAVPGQVCFQVDGDPVIACGSGLLRLSELSVGEKPHLISARKVLSSLRNRLTNQTLGSCS